MGRCLRVGISGYGVVGKRRQEFINRRIDMKTVAVCDRVFEGSGKLLDGTKYHKVYHQLLEEKLDVLFVCMSNDMAAEVTVAGLEKGLHVFCEKPPGRNLRDIARVRASEKIHPNLKLKYGFNHRYHESVREALRILKTGELGKIVNLKGVYGKSQIVTFGKQADWRTNREVAGGGILLDQGIHMVDLFLYLGGDFDNIHAVVSNLGALGVETEERQDGFTIPPGQTIQGGLVRTYGDHRIAMSFAIAGLIALDAVHLDDPDCCAISFPDFFQNLSAVTE
mgnify:CR=1 FL=1